ncbi:mitogen-activated protein kinase, putative, partial [Bodo saltans]
MPPCVVSLRVVLTSMILIVAVIAAAISFAPLYTASLSSATNSGDSFSGSISREIGQSVTANFNNMQSTVTTMVTAAYLNAWSSTDIASMIRWMNYAIALGADTVNIALDTNVTWTASYVAPDGSLISANQFVLIRYNGSTAVVYIINTTGQLSITFGPLTFPSNLTFQAQSFYPGIRQRPQSWGAPYSSNAFAVLPCGAPLRVPNGTSFGAFVVTTRTKVIVDYMLSLKVATTGRAMLVDPSNGLFIASNNAADPLTKVVNGTTVVASYTDVVDPLIRKVVSG